MRGIKGLRGVKELRVILGILLAILLGMGVFGCSKGDEGEKRGTEISKKNIDEKVFLRLDPGGHTAVIKDIFFFDHGKRLISASDDKTIRIWDVSDLRRPKLIRTIRGEIGRGPFGQVFAIALDPSERILAVGGFLAHGHGINDDLVGIVRLHDLKSGKVLQVLKGHENVVLSLAFSPDGKYLASGSGDFTVIIWKKEGNGYRRYKRLKGHEDAIYALSFSRERLATGSYDHTVRIYDVKNSFRLIKVLKDHEDEVRAVSFSPDGRHLVTGSWDKRILLYDRDGNLIREFSKKETRPAALSFSPDGRFLLAGSFGGAPNNTCYLYEFPSGRVKAAFKGHKNSVFAVSATQRDGRLILATGGGEAKEILLWDEGGRILSRMESAGTAIFSAAISPDGKRVGFGFTQGKLNYGGPLEFSFVLNAMKLERISSEKGLLRAREKRGGLELSLNRSLSKEMGLFYPESLLEMKRGGEVISRVKRDPKDGYRHNCFSFINDRLFISGGVGGKVFVYNLRGEKAAELMGHEGEVWAVSVTPDGKWAVTGASDQTVRIWYLGDIKEGKFKKLLPTLTLFPSKDGKEWVAWTPEGYFTVSSSSALRLIGYHINQGFYKQARWASFSQLYDIYFRPDLVKLKLAHPEEDLTRYTNIARVKELLENSPPPEVEIVSPSDGKVEKAETIRLTLKIRDQGGGIGDIRVYLNGSAVIVDRLGKEETGKEVFKDYILNLQEGKNTISALAFNKENTVQSNTAKVKVIADYHRLKKPSLYAVVIGINQFENPDLTLKYAVADARLFADALRKVARPLFRKVVIKELLTKGETTKENIVKALKALRHIRTDDVFVLYVASHGYIEDGKYFLITSNVGSLWTLKRDALSQDLLTELAANIPSTKKLIIIDTCQAGAVGSAIQVALLTRGMSSATAIKILSRSVGSTILAASTSLQDALEGYHGHGLFTYVLVKGLLGEADLARTGVIETIDLAKYVNMKVPEISERVFKKRQYPTIEIHGQPFPIGKVR